MFQFNPSAVYIPIAADQQRQRQLLHRQNPAAEQLPPVYVPNTAPIDHHNYCSHPGPNALAGSGPAAWVQPPQVTAAEVDYLASDEFRMYGFKIANCPLAWSHDWTVCPYAHLGEKARRRDPRKVDYLAIACPEFRSWGRCSRGETCFFAHGVFEYWLHPARYRTRACKAGEYCRRKVCFFAHGPNQLRPETRYRFAVNNEGTSAAVTTSAAVNVRPRVEVGGGGGDGRVVEEVKPELKLEFLESIRRFSEGIKDNGGSLMSWGSNVVERESEFPNVDWINDLIE